MNGRSMRLVPPHADPNLASKVVRPFGDLFDGETTRPAFALNPTKTVANDSRRVRHVAPANPVSSLIIRPQQLWTLVRGQENPGRRCVSNEAIQHDLNLNFGGVG